jgi:hypothetical protein
VQELVACNSEDKEALVDPLEAVRKIAQAGPHAFHRVAVNTHAIRVTTSILADAMVDHTMYCSQLKGIGLCIRQGIAEANPYTHGGVYGFAFFCCRIRRE